MDMKAEEKGKILKENYGIEVNAELGKEMEHMCNLGEGLVEEAYEEGMEKGIEKGIEKEHLRQIKNKLEKNKSLEQIAEEVELDVENVKYYIEILKSN